MTRPGENFKNCTTGKNRRGICCGRSEKRQFHTVSGNGCFMYWHNDGQTTFSKKICDRKEMNIKNCWWRMSPTQNLGDRFVHLCNVTGIKAKSVFYSQSGKLNIQYKYKWWNFWKDYNGERPAPPGSFVPRKDEYGVPIPEPQSGFNNVDGFQSCHQNFSHQCHKPLWKPS